LQTDLPVHKDRPPEIAFYLSAIAEANWLQPSDWLLEFEEFMLSKKKKVWGIRQYYSMVRVLQG
jgi:hypothetical protein